MLTQEDIKLLSDMFDEKLKPIKQDVSQIKEDMNTMKEEIDLIKEDIDLMKEDLQEVRGTVNSLSEWAEAVTEYHFPDLHYPLHDDEKIS